MLFANGLDVFIDGWILLYLKNSDEYLAEQKSDKKAKVIQYGSEAIKIDEAETTTGL
jgi:hypothetical protein